VAQRGLDEIGERRAAVVPAAEIRERRPRPVGGEVGVDDRERRAQAAAAQTITQHARDVAAVSSEYVWETDAEWRYTLISGVIPAIPLIVIRPFLP